MNDAISLINPVDGKPWLLDARWTEYCAMLMRRNIWLTPQYETIRDMMLAGF